MPICSSSGPTTEGWQPPACGRPGEGGESNAGHERPWGDEMRKSAQRVPHWPDGRAEENEDQGGRSGRGVARAIATM
eukprot:4413251-Pyramimonas_sp.AAC.1